MAIVLRATKGSALTHNELDNNFTELNTLKATLADPTFTGVPAAPTAAVDTDSTQIATTAFVRDILPAGVTIPYAGTSAPSGWLWCTGQAVSRTTYATLFAAIGTTFGVGDGSSTFNVPDVRGRVVAGKDNMSGADAGRLTNQTGGVDGDTLGAAGGAETHTLTTAQLAVHAHTITDPTHNHALDSGGSAVTSALGSGVIVNSGLGTEIAFGAVSHNSTGITGTNNAGSGSAHNNVQPTIILNYIIKT